MITRPLYYFQIRFLVAQKHQCAGLGQPSAGGQLVSLQLQDRGYDRCLLTFGKLSSNLWVRWLVKTARLLGLNGRNGIRQLLAAYDPVDQTSAGQNAQAQIQLIVQKQS